MMQVYHNQRKGIVSHDLLSRDIFYCVKKKKFKIFYFSSFLQNPYFFMYASLVAPDTDEELHLLRDGKTRSTTGSVVSSLYHLKDIDNSDAGFFVFPDLSVRMEGTYRLKLSLFEIIGYV